MASESDTSDRLFPPGDTLKDLLFGDPVPLSESRSILARHYRGQSLDIFVRWGLDADDAVLQKVAKQLARRCGSDEEHRRRILDVVDQVARAERAKVAWAHWDGLLAWEVRAPLSRVCSRPTLGSLGWRWRSVCQRACSCWSGSPGSGLSCNPAPSKDGALNG